MTQDEIARLQVIGRVSLMVAEAHWLYLSIEGKTEKDWFKLVEIATTIPEPLVRQMVEMAK